MEKLKKKANLFTVGRRLSVASIRLASIPFKGFIDSFISSRSLFRGYVGRSIINKYCGVQGHGADKGDGFLGFGLIHYAYIRNLQPDAILCIGSYMGFIPAILAMACRDNRRGHVDFIDAAYDRDQPRRHWNGIGFWKKNNASKHFSKIGVNHYITTHVMTSSEYLKRNARKRYQYIYIDGDHSYLGAKRDYLRFWPKLDPGGLMLFHDISERGYLDQGLYGVWRFWEEIKKKHTSCQSFNGFSGLGVLQK